MGQNAVDFHTADMLFAFLAFDDCIGANAFDEVIAHACQGGISVHARFCFHFDDTVFHQFQFVLAQLQHIHNTCIVFNEFGAGKTHGQASFFRMVFNLVTNRMDTTVDRSLFTEVNDLCGPFFLCHTDCRLYQFFDTFVFRSTDGHNGNAQGFGHFFHVDGTAVVADFVHHVQRQNHGNPHFHEL